MIHKMVKHAMEDTLIQRVKAIVLQHFSAQDVRIYLFGLDRGHEGNKNEALILTLP